MRSRRLAICVGAGLAAAAVLALALRTRGPGDVIEARMATAPQDLSPRVVPPGPAPRVNPSAESEPTRPSEPIVRAPRPTREQPRLRSASFAGDADYAHETAREGDIVRLKQGELTVDATEARPVQVITGDTTLSIRRAKVSVVARNGVIAQVSVFAGTAELRVASKPVVIEAGAVWERPDPRPESLAAFRDGWAALRAGRNTDAIAAFDRAIDPTVAEDALYWPRSRASARGSPWRHRAVSPAARAVSIVGARGGCQGCTRTPRARLRTVRPPDECPELGQTPTLRKRDFAGIRVENGGMSRAVAECYDGCGVRPPRDFTPRSRRGVRADRRRARRDARRLLSAGSWLIKHAPEEAGLEPDECYNVGDFSKDRPESRDRGRVDERWRRQARDLSPPRNPRGLDVDQRCDSRFVIDGGRFVERSQSACVPSFDVTVVLELMELPSLGDELARRFSRVQ